MMLDKFVLEVERRLAAPDLSTVGVRAAGVHRLISLAGNVGFMKPRDICREIEEEARHGTGPNRLADLRTARETAVEAARDQTVAAAAPLART
jgi:hypothetical protein